MMQLFAHNAVLEIAISPIRVIPEIRTTSISASDLSIIFSIT